MPYADLGQVRLYYVLDGPADAPVLTLSNSLGTCADMWSRQVPALSAHFRVLRYDTRGHGLSSAPPGDYTFEQLGGDVAGLLAHLGIARTHFCGLSMGGPTGMWLALHRPDLVDGLVLSNTAARIGSVESWTERIRQVREQGLENMASTVVERWLTNHYRASDPASAQILVDMLRRTGDEGYAANCAALRDGDLRAESSRIRARTLVIAGTHDVAATPEQGRELAATIPDARYLELDASHLANWELPQTYADAVLDFLRD